MTTPDAHRARAPGHPRRPVGGPGSRLSRRRLRADRAACGSDPPGASPKGGFPWQTSRARARSRPRPPWRPIAVALVIIALVVVAALAYVGSQPRRVPPPFGPARERTHHVRDRAATSTSAIRSTGRQPARWSAASTETTTPGFSPDGTLIAFLRSSRRVQRRPVHRYGRDGTDLKRITTAPIESIAWSHLDARQPAYRG